MKAIVRCFAPDCWASAAGLSPVQASKYGAKTCAGSGVAAWAVPAAPTSEPAEIAVRASKTDIRGKDLRRRICAPVPAGAVPRRNTARTPSGLDQTNIGVKVQTTKPAGWPHPLLASHFSGR